MSTEFDVIELMVKESLGEQYGVVQSIDELSVVITTTVYAKADIKQWELDRLASNRIAMINYISENLIKAISDLQKQLVLEADSLSEKLK